MLKIFHFKTQRMKQFIVFFLLLAFHYSYSQSWFRYSKISPDGSKIAFCYKGDIYVVPSSGGQANVVIFSDYYEFMPVWSNDGKHLAFAADRYGNFDVFVYSFEDNSTQRLTYHSANDLPYCFSHDDQQVIFASTRVDEPENRQFPSRILSELYAVPVKGGMNRMMLTTPAQDVFMSKNGQFMLFHDVKGYEDAWRKHHTSSVTRDIWLYDFENKEHRQLTNNEGEDRNPVLASNQSDFYFLSERSGSFNIFKSSITNPAQIQQITKFKNHPVRFLSIARNNVLCFSYHGDLYTLQPNQEPQKLNITIANENKQPISKPLTLSNDITEFALSPNGKEVAFVARGDIFVSSIEGNTTKQLTFTSYQERSISFNNEGNQILFAAEKDSSWKIFTLSLKNPKEKYFYNATEFQIQSVISSSNECFQPKYSPDNQFIAYIEERTTLKLLNLKTQQQSTLLAAQHNYSYSDGDQWFEWSPDSKWITCTLMPSNTWLSEIAIIPIDSPQTFINLSLNGYDDGKPFFHPHGKAVYWFSNKHGLRNHASWGTQNDIYVCFLTKQHHELFKLSQEELAAWKEEHKEEYQKDTADFKIVIDLDNLHKRKLRLTPFSAYISDAIWSKDYYKLYFIAKTEAKYDLYVHKFLDKETKVLYKLNANSASQMYLSKDQKHLFVLADGKIYKIDTESGTSKTLSTSKEWQHDFAQEKRYLFEHIWRQTLKKFYKIDLHGVDWNFYKNEYLAKLPHINNNYDFAELCSELLGELNASHTGCRYYHASTNGDETASLAFFIDYSFNENGIKIKDFITGSPLIANPSSLIDKGSIIQSIDNQMITKEIDFHQLLNRKANQWIRVKGVNSKGQAFDEKVKPISYAEEQELLYQRWISVNEQEVEQSSNGKIGYVHVRAMNDASFRDFYETVLGKHINKEALIVDTRFNGGGWLHDDLCTFLAGKKYVDIEPREQYVGYEPQRKWIKPSCVLVGEGNYSDAHFFPYAYKALNIGKLIGMPVPGTATAVWWEKLIDPTLVFGIPQVGIKTLDGKFLENNQLNPDIKVFNDYDNIANGKDFQIERAILEMKKTLPSKN